MTWKLYAVVSAGAFVATYLVSAPKTELAQSRASTAPAATVPSPRASAAASEIEALADSLHVRLHSDAVFQTPRRDPFHFQARAQRPAAFVPPPAAVVADAPPPPLPVLSLSGIASDVLNGKPQRSAVISLPAGVLIVREGESVAGLYTVVAIGEDAIDLLSSADGSRRTLRLAGR
jgi:hypothetical protein